MSFPYGSLVRLTFSTFSDANEQAPADPTGLTLYLRDGAGVETTVSWPGDITRDDVGQFHYDVSGSGSFAEQWVATGTVTTGKAGRFEIDAKYGTAFATAEQLAATLGVAVPTDTLILSRWNEALADASGYLRTVIGQPINAGSVTLDLLTDSSGEVDVWLVPVTGITSITALDTGLTVDTDRWQLKDQRLYLPRGCTTYRVVLTYGYFTIPTELVRWTKVLAAAQIQVAAAGNLGVDNVTSVAVDDGKVTYTDAMAVALPDSTAQWLKATFGGPQ